MIRKCPDCGRVFWARNEFETYCAYDGDPEPVALEGSEENNHAE